MNVAENMLFYPRNFVAPPEFLIHQVTDDVSKITAVVVLAVNAAIVEVSLSAKNKQRKIINNIIRDPVIQDFDGITVPVLVRS